MRLFLIGGTGGIERDHHHPRKERKKAAIQAPWETPMGTLLTHTQTTRMRYDEGSEMIAVEYHIHTHIIHNVRYTNKHYLRFSVHTILMWYGGSLSGMVVGAVITGLHT